MKVSSLVEQLQSALMKKEQFPEGAMYALVLAIEDSIRSSDTKRLTYLAKTLQAITKASLSASPEVAQALTAWSQTHVQELPIAFNLGQVSFAQALASEASAHTPNEAFLSALTDIRYRSYLNVMLKSPKTGKELQAACGEAAETVSRKLGILRELGICDFKKQGTHSVNFLTPASREILEDFQNHEELTPIGNEAAMVLEPFKAMLPEYFQRPPTFSHLVQDSHTTIVETETLP